MKIIIISAIAKNGVIGRSNGEMPWHVSEEFQHFKNTTLGYPIIMGRKTFEALGKPLKGRLNVVLTKSTNFHTKLDELKIFNSLNESIKYFNEQNIEKIFIIGGGKVYAQAIQIADEMILSFMNFEAEGDIIFPEFNKSNWEVLNRDKRNEFEIFYYARKK